METMIERISSMIVELYGNNHDWHHYSDDAYAIVREMHRPTDAMIAAAENRSGAAAWEAMIGAILNERA